MVNKSYFFQASVEKDKEVLEDRSEEEMEDGVRENTETRGGDEENGMENGNAEKDLVEDGDDGLGEAKNIIGMDPNKEYLVISFHHLPQCLYDGDKEKANWIAWPELGINATTDKIKELLRTDEPKNILVLAYQKFVHNTNVTTLEKHLNEVSKMAMESIHNLAIGNFFYVPQFERIWDRKTALNQHVRLLNLNCGLPPCNVQKRFLVSYNKGRVHYVRPNLFTEYVKGSGVGETLSYAGYVRLMQVALKYLYNAFEEMERPVSRAMAGDTEPPPLFLTPGYKTNVVMQRHIREAGLRQPSRPRVASEEPEVVKPAPANRGRGRFRGQGAARAATTNRGRGRYRGQDRRYATRSQSRVREKVRDNGLEWTKEDDMSADEWREYKMKKLEKRRFGPDADKLAEPKVERDQRGAENEAKGE